MPKEENKEEKLVREIDDFSNKIIGNLNDFDMRTQKIVYTQNAIDKILGGVELSRVEKIGLLSFIMAKRTKISK